MRIIFPRQIIKIHQWIHLHCGRSRIRLPIGCRCFWQVGKRLTHVYVRIPCSFGSMHVVQTGYCQFYPHRQRRIAGRGSYSFNPILLGPCKWKSLILYFICFYLSLNDGRIREGPSPLPAHCFAVGPTVRCPLSNLMSKRVGHNENLWCGRIDNCCCYCSNMSAPEKDFITFWFHLLRLAVFMDVLVCSKLRICR